MNAPLLRSRFTNVYLGIASIWVAIGLLLSLVTSSFVVPKILQSRVRDLESLASSQRDALLYNDNRPIRDELLREGVIAKDQDFDELRAKSSSDRQSLAAMVRGCHWITETVCTNKDSAIVLSEPRNQMSPTFALVIRTSYYSEVQRIGIYKALGWMLLLAFFSFAAWAIRQQEKFLLQKIDLLASTFKKIEASFRSEGLPATAPGEDEFSSISVGIQRAGELIAKKTEEIEKYKKEFERRTRLEQLAQTISYTSHNLKAPLLEGAEFLRDLPEFMDTMPRDTLQRSIKSLENRLRSGATALQAAIQSTRESQLRPEPLKLDRVLGEFKREIEANPQLKSVAIDVDVASMEDASIYFSPLEIHSVLWNLLTNSLEAKRDSRILISAQCSGEAVTVLFRDNGPGIPEPLLDKVFDDFFTTKSKGSGLGLPGVKRSIERGRGSIRAVPSDEGASFEMRFPLFDVSSAGDAHA